MILQGLWPFSYDMGNTRNAYLNQGCTQYTIDAIGEINYGDHTIISPITGIVLHSDAFSIDLDQINSIYEEYHECLHGGVKDAAGWWMRRSEFMARRKQGRGKSPCARRCFAARKSASSPRTA